eukprot:TRINITY_DN7121_c1_g1_i4.p1 TRINITY_DN7121_c1_g1~~TRINITY_DN7121_c1_g1_i4.p1  ORF type:complete len:253 (-),score=70.48 TRINITY_DN7121_c1_g1_i4:26-784(-)
MFGQLKSFNLVRDSSTGLSKGFAFCEYADPYVTDTACSSLNGTNLGDKSLVVQRASVNQTVKKTDAPVNVDARAALMLTLSSPAAQLLATATKNATLNPTRVLVLMNIINMYDFPGEHEEAEYQELIEDITEECARYGNVVKVLIPRPLHKLSHHTVEHFDGNNWVDDDNNEDDDSEEQRREDERTSPPGFGKVYVEYEKIEHAKRAQTALGGRRYDGRMVITTYLDEEKWAAGDLETTTGPDEEGTVTMEM